MCVFFFVFFLPLVNCNDQPKAINEFDFKAIGSAELVQDVEVVTGLFTPGAPMLLEVKVNINKKQNKTRGKRSVMNDRKV